MREPTPGPGAPSVRTARIGFLVSVGVTDPVPPRPEKGHQLLLVEDLLSPDAAVAAGPRPGAGGPSAGVAGVAPEAAATGRPPAGAGDIALNILPQRLLGSEGASGVTPAAAGGAGLRPLAGLREPNNPPKTDPIPDPVSDRAPPSVLTAAAAAVTSPNRPAVAAARSSSVGAPPLIPYRPLPKSHPAHKCVHLNLPEYRC